MKLYLKEKDWENLEKGFKVGLIEGVIVGGIFTVIGILFLFFLYMGVIDFGQGDLSIKFIHKQQKQAYERVVGYWQENDFVESLSYVCSFQETEKQQVECVFDYVNDIFDYTEHGIGNQIRRSPEEILLEGAVCRDYSVLFFSLYERMGFECNFIHKPRHVYINVTCEDCDFYCDVDMDSLLCFEK